jgi:pimeloyl-ACP methyl ester carboxylesterase
VSSVQEWWAAGEQVTLELCGTSRRVFVARMGEGPPLTLLHGFPSSSHDWERVARELAAHRSLLMPDLLGFGASEKPAEHVYSLHEQADLVEALWRHEGIGATELLAHDHSVSVTQELLARASERPLAAELRSVLFLNGGIYPELHRPQPGQLALLDPEHGPQVSALLNEELFVSGLAPTFAPGYAGAGADSEQMWLANSRDDGARNMHLLIRYMSDRETHRERWVAALESTSVPLSFAWGMLDPVSGAHMAERIAERLPRAPLLALEDVAHWPALEAPGRVAAGALAA